MMLKNKYALDALFGGHKHSTGANNVINSTKYECAGT